MKRTALIAAAMLFVSQVVAAQMTGMPRHHSASPGAGSGDMGGFGMNGGMSGVMGQSLIVGPDGALYVLRAPSAAATAVEVVAIRPTGTTAWTAKVDGPMTRLVVTGNLLLVASGEGDMGMDSNTVPDQASRLVALSTASGSPQWQVDLDGAAATIQPFTGGVYVLVMHHDPMTGGGMMGSGPAVTRSIVAVDNAGKVLWKLALNP
jgi:outer membrane protein assembly factor BamB